MKQSNKPAKRKLTALIPGDLIDEVHKFAKGKDLTESVIIMMDDWTRKQRLKTLHNQIRKKPLEFKYSAKELRELNRKR